MTRQPERPLQALIRIGGPINARVPGTRATSTPARPLTDIVADLQSARRANVALAVFAGGEPTLRTDLGLLLRAASRLGLGAGLLTNGRMLAYPRVRHAIVQQQANYVQIALHAGQPSLHDSIVEVPGAFDQTTSGLQALLGEASDRCLVEVACTVTPANLAHLPAWAAFVLALSQRARLGLRFVCPAGGVGPDALASTAQAAQAVAHALETLQCTAPQAAVAWEGFPPCLLPAFERCRDERLRMTPLAFGAEQDGTAALWETPSQRTHPLPCQECALELTCPGAPAAMIEREGHGSLRPTRAVRSNSFNYEFVQDLPEFQLRSGACSAMASPPGGPPERSVLLARDDIVSLFRTPTRDFTNGQIAFVKNQLEQLYLDTGKGATLRSFFTDVRRLRWHPACPGCPDRGRCCRAVVIDPAPPFEQEESWLRDRFRALRGRILDLGCGEHLYREELSALVSSGLVEYHGVDPDAEALAGFASAVPGVHVHRGTIDDLPHEPASFDTVLCLRAVHHIPDLGRAFDVISRLLRVGGALVLCDSPPLAMLRTAAQVRLADQTALAGHEHYRNWTSHQVLEFLTSFPLRVRKHRPVSPETSNEWLLELTRVGIDEGSR